MLLNEIIKEVGMTKRAVKYYEEKGLLSVDKVNWFKSQGQISDSSC